MLSFCANLYALHSFRDRGSATLCSTRKLGWGARRLEQFFATVLAAFVAGLSQGLTGFGSNICMMMVFPHFYTLAAAASVSMAISTPVNLQMAYLHRKGIIWKPVVILSIVNILVACVIISLSTQIDNAIAKKSFGVFFILLCIYFLFFKKEGADFGNPLKKWVSVLLIVASGIVDGLFGVGGPLVVVYFMSISLNREQYVGSLNAYFFFTQLFYSIYRAIIGLITVDDILVIVVGIGAILLGGVIADKIASKLNAKVVAFIIYLMIGVAGLINVLA